MKIHLTIGAAMVLASTPAYGQSWPFPADMSPTFAPKSIDFTVSDVRALGQLQIAERAIFGRVGLYAYCETTNGVRELKPSGGGSNNILNLSRAQATTNVDSLLQGNRGTRRFAYDAACLANGRIGLQIQTNLKRRGPIARRDTNFGYRATMIYLDQLPGATLTRGGIRAVSRGHWALEARETGGARDLYRPFGQTVELAGSIRLAQ